MKGKIKKFYSSGKYKTNHISRFFRNNKEPAKPFRTFFEGSGHSILVAEEDANKKDVPTGTPFCLVS